MVLRSVDKRPLMLTYCAQHQSRSIPSSERLDDLYGRSQALNNSHRPRGMMVPNPKGNVTLASDKAYRVQSAGREFSPEQILPSIEKPCQVMEARNPFQQRSGGALHHVSQSMSRDGEHGDWKSPVARVLASSDLDMGRKRRFEVEGALPSPYNQSNVTTGTVLIPIEKYNERHGKEARFFDSEHHPGHVAPEQRGYHHLAESKWHDPLNAVEYSDRIEDPPRLVRASAGHYQRPPHLQIQLQRGAAGVRSASPTCLKSTISNSSMFPISKDDQSTKHGVPNHVFLTRSDKNLPENGYVQQAPASALDTLRDVPTTVRDLPRQLDTQATTSYTHNSGHPRYTDDPWVERNDPSRAYFEPRPTSHGGMDNASLSMRENQEPYHRHPQHLVEPGAIIRDLHHYTELPLRTRQDDDQAHIPDFRPDDHYGRNSSPSGLRHQNILRYVAFPSGLNCCSDLEYFVHDTDRSRSSERESRLRDRSAVRPQMITYISYESRNDFDQGYMRGEPERSQDSRREFVVID